LMRRLTVSLTREISLISALWRTRLIKDKKRSRHQ
jgi:hypothetical protein